MRPGSGAAVAAAFDRAAPTYEQAAQVQARVARSLAGRVAAARLPARPRVLEIGCGTGLYSRELVAALPDGRFLFTDVAPAMVARCRAAVTHPHARFAVVDGQAPDLDDRGFDLVTSSFVFQWFEDLERSLARLRTYLRPGGHLLFATLGADTFQEWRAAHAAAGLEAGTPAWPTPEGFPWPAGQSGRVEVERVLEHPGDARRFLRGLKDIGAQVPRPGHRPLTVPQLRRVMDRFDEVGVVTWQVLFGHAVAG